MKKTYSYKYIGVNNGRFGVISKRIPFNDKEQKIIIASRDAMKATTNPNTKVSNSQMMRFPKIKLDKIVNHNNKQFTARGLRAHKITPEVTSMTPRAKRF